LEVDVMLRNIITRKLRKPLALLLAFGLLVTAAALSAPKIVAGAEGSDALPAPFEQTVRAEAAPTADWLLYGQFGNGNLSEDGSVVLYYTIADINSRYLIASRFEQTLDALAVYDELNDALPPEDPEIPDPVRAAYREKFLDNAQTWYLLDVVYSNSLFADELTDDEYDAAFANSSVAYVVATANLENFSFILIEKNGERFFPVIDSAEATETGRVNSDDETEDAEPAPELPELDVLPAAEPTETPESADAPELIIAAPTEMPEETPEPTSEPTSESSADPTEAPEETPEPTPEPTAEPTETPTPEPTEAPTETPEPEPTATPAELPPEPETEPEAEPEPEYTAPDGIDFVPNGAPDAILGETEVYFVPNESFEVAAAVYELDENVDVPPTVEIIDYDVPNFGEVNYPTADAEEGHVWVTKTFTAKSPADGIYEITLTAHGNTYDGNNPLEADTYLTITNSLNDSYVVVDSPITPTVGTFDDEIWAIPASAFDSTTSYTLTYQIKVDPTLTPIPNADLLSGKAKVVFTPAFGNDYYYTKHTYVIGSVFDASGNFSVTGGNGNNGDKINNQSELTLSKNNVWQLYLNSDKLRNINVSTTALTPTTFTYSGEPTATAVVYYTNHSFADGKNFYTFVVEITLNNKKETVTFTVSIVGDSGGPTINETPIEEITYTYYVIKPADDGHTISKPDDAPTDVEYTINQYAVTTPHAILLQLLDAETDDPIAGATFELKQDGTVIETYNTNANGLIELTKEDTPRLLLPTGTYTLEQTATVDGYEPLTHTFSFEIESGEELYQQAANFSDAGNGNILGKTPTTAYVSVSHDDKLITVYNTSSKGQIEIIKVVTDTIYPIAHGEATFLYEIEEYNGDTFVRSWVRYITFDITVGNKAIVDVPNISHSYKITELKSARYAFASATVSIVGGSEAFSNGGYVEKANFITQTAPNKPLATVTFTNTKTNNQYLSGTDVAVSAIS
jgi:hypothetical protein